MITVRINARDENGSKLYLARADYSWGDLASGVAGRATLRIRSKHTNVDRMTIKLGGCVMIAPQLGLPAWMGAISADPVDDQATGETVIQATELHGMLSNAIAGWSNSHGEAYGSAGMALHSVIAQAAPMGWAVVAGDAANTTVGSMLGPNGFGVLGSTVSGAAQSMRDSANIGAGAAYDYDNGHLMVETEGPGAGNHFDTLVCDPVNATIESSVGSGTEGHTIMSVATDDLGNRAIALDPDAAWPNGVYSTGSGGAAGAVGERARAGLYTAGGQTATLKLRASLFGIRAGDTFRLVRARSSGHPELARCIELMVADAELPDTVRCIAAIIEPNLDTPLKLPRGRSFTRWGAGRERIFTDTRHSRRRWREQGS